jgi:AcrR family transcriptional regulator
MDPEAHPLPPDRHALPLRILLASQRDRLLHGMVRAVALRGYAETTVNDIVLAARTSRRTFYEHFRNKEACFLAAYDAGVELALTRMAAAWNRPAPLPQRLEAGFGAFMELVLEQPQLARLCIVETLAAGPAALERRQAALVRFADVLHASAATDPQAAALPELLPELLIGGISAAIYNRLRRDDLEGLRPRVPELLAWAMLAYVGEQP